MGQPREQGPLVAEVSRQVDHLETRFTAVPLDKFCKRRVAAAVVDSDYLPGAPSSRECRDQFGADRLMWASDCPFQVDPGHNYHDSIALVRDRLDFLTASDKAAMLHGTAKRVFFS
jgi:predicted TIM-barrel fold metal-dependent hydrolase